MGSSLEATLRLEIADYQASLAKATGEAAKFKEKLLEQGRQGVKAIDAIAAANQRLEVAGLRTQQLFAPKAVNPWAANASAAAQYAQVVETKVVTAMQHAAAAQEAAASKAMRAQFLGHSTGGEFDNNHVLAMQAQRSRAAAAGAGGRGAGGGGRMQIGMAAMQFQDIAVQAQMGTRASIILGQQGSQLLSSFGAGGAIAGGVIAIGAAFYTMGENARKAFDEAKVEAEKFDAELKVISAGTLPEMAAGLGKVDDRLKEWTDELKDLSGTFSFGANIADIFGGPDVEERIKLAGDQLTNLGKKRAELANNMLALSGKEAAIATVRASGEEEKAVQMERELKLLRELTRIKALPLPRNMRAQLAADATTKSNMEAVAPRNTKKEREEVAALEAKIGAEKLKQLDPADRYLELSKEQDAVFQRMTTEGGLFYDQSIAGLEAWAAAKKQMGDTTGLVKVLKMLEQAKELEDQMAAAGQQTRDNTIKRDDKRDKDNKDASALTAARQRFDLEIKIAKEKSRTGKDDGAAITAFQDELNTLQLTAQIQDQLKVSQGEALRLAREKVTAERAATTAIENQVKAGEAKKQLGGRQELAAEMRVDALRAGGHEQAAQAQERQIKIVREARSMQESLGMSEAQSLAIARQKIALEEAAANKQDHAKGAGAAAQPGHIGGVTRRQMMSSGLDEFHRNQRRDGTAATAFGAHGLSGRGTSTIKSHFMGGRDGGSLKERGPMHGMQEGNASKQDRTDNGLKDINGKMLEVLIKGFFG